MKDFYKNPWVNAVIILIITILLYTTLLSSRLDEVFIAIKNANQIYLTIALLIHMLVILFAAYVLYKLADLVSGSTSYWTSFKASLIGMMAAGLLPLGSGMQVFQFYVFKKEKMKSADVVALLWLEFIIYQAALVIIAWGIVLLNLGYIIKSPFRIGLLIGLIITSIVLVGLVLMSYSQTFYKLLIKVIVWGIKTLRLKVNIIEIENNLQNQISQFKEALLLFKDNLALIIRLLLVSGLRMVSLLSVGYFVARAFHINNIDWFSVISFHMLIMLLSSFIPIPGASGSTEFFFYQFFKPLYGNMTTIVLVSWRFISYYLVVMSGALLFFIVRFNQRRDVS